MKQTVLVVDDDLEGIRLLTDVLERMGCAVIPACGGADAQRKAELHKPDLVVTELALPNISGIALIQALKTNPQTRYIPVIAVAASTFRSIVERAAISGCDAFLGKPFSVADLMRTVERYLATPLSQHALGFG